MTSRVLTTAEPAETEAIGEALGAMAEPGLVVGLIGPLGAGKTRFVKGFARGAGVPSEQLIASPTFVLIHEYEGRLPVHHFDTYRLPDVDSFLRLGLDEYFFGPGVALVEWADRFREALPDERLEIELEPTGPSARTLTLRPFGPTAERLIARAFPDARPAN
jgi:tRNA threonylcarbamoyladenosine biosynthesis protein TsaE